MNRIDPLGLDGWAIGPFFVVIPFDVTTWRLITRGEYWTQWEHELQHSYDSWNPKIPYGPILEQRGWAAEATELRSRIARLEKKKKCLLTESEKENLFMMKIALGVAENNSTADSARRYWESTHPSNSKPLMMYITDWLEK